MLFFMEARDLLRHHIIESLIAPQAEHAADAAIPYWEQMATQIISIVGEEGFNSLYARSVSFAQAIYPWLAAGAQPPQPDRRFAELKMSFAGQSPVEVRAANNLLLITYTNILAALIGEELTTRILRLAWGNNASNNTGKEFVNE
jgi:hypothetical protein